jgi:hypothetical protein
MATKTKSRTPPLPFPRHGGARRGAGRKPSSARSRVSHQARSRLASRHPVLVTIRVRPGLPSLRGRRELALIRSRLELASDRLGTRLVHYSVQSNHVHLIVEAADERALGRAMKGVCVRIVRALNRLWRRKGAVLDDHYHARILKTPREVRNALAYVLHNARKHGVNLAGADPCSSGLAFDGWKNSTSAITEGRAPSIARARTWLLSIGWRRHGLIAMSERPGRRRRTASNRAFATSTPSPARATFVRGKEKDRRCK